MGYPYSKNTERKGVTMGETIGIIVLIITAVIPFALIIFGMVGGD